MTEEWQGLWGTKQKSTYHDEGDGCRSNRVTVTRHTSTYYGTGRTSKVIVTRQKSTYRYHGAGGRWGTNRVTVTEQTSTYSGTDGKWRTNRVTVKEQTSTDRGTDGRWRTKGWQLQGRHPLTVAQMVNEEPKGDSYRTDIHWPWHRW